MVMSIPGRTDNMKKKQWGRGVGVYGEVTPQCRMSMEDQAGEGGWASGEGPASRTHLKPNCYLKQSSDMTRSGV